MPVKRFGPQVDAAEIRALSAPAPADAVAAILREVSEGGDSALLAIERRVGNGALEELRVPTESISAAANGLEVEMLEALRLSIANVELAAAARKASAESGSSNDTVGRRRRSSIRHVLRVIA